MKADGNIPWALNLAQAAAGAFDFATSIIYSYFLANERRATPLSISCVLKRRFFVIKRLFYDACSAEKTKDLICPQESIPFDSIGFTIRFALVLFVVAILCQGRWLIFWATIAQAARAARDSMVVLISISCFKL